MDKHSTQDTSSNIVEMEDMRPHATFVDPLTGNAHVLPVSLVRQWLANNVDVEPEIVRAILHDWLIDNAEDEVLLSQQPPDDEHAALNDKYYELLNAVETKVDGKTRHEQALALIKLAQSNGGVEQFSKDEESQ